MEKNKREERLRKLREQGNDFSKNKNWRDLLTTCDAIIELDPKDQKAYNNRGVAKDMLGQTAQAIEDYNQVIELDPNNALAYYNRGNAKVKLGQLEQAIEDYNQAIKLDSNNALAYNNRDLAKKGERLVKQAVDFFKSEKWDDFIKICDEIIELNPNYALVYYNRGNAKYKLGQFEQAIEDYDRAIKLGPKEPVYFYNRAEAKLKLSQIQEAKNDLDTALNLENKFPAAIKLYKEITASAEKGKELVDQFFSKIKDRIIKDGIEYAPDSRYIFRGENQGYRIVKTSLLRSFPDHPEDATQLKENGEINKHQENQLREARKYFPDHTAPLEILSDIQHFRGPTNLLDFTKSFHIALFFALENYQEKNQSAEDELPRIIRYRVDLKKHLERVEEIKEIDQLFSDKVKDKVIYYEPKHTQNRVVFQSSVFLYLPWGYLETGNLETGKYDIYPINVMEIKYSNYPKSTDRENILYYLDRVHNINHETIYSDRFGLIETWRRQNKELRYPGMVSKIKDQLEIEKLKKAKEQTPSEMNDLLSSKMNDLLSSKTNDL